MRCCGERARARVCVYASACLLVSLSLRLQHGGTCFIPLRAAQGSAFVQGSAFGYVCNVEYMAFLAAYTGGVLLDQRLLKVPLLPPLPVSFSFFLELSSSLLPLSPRWVPTEALAALWWLDRRKPRPSMCSTPQ